MRRFDIQSELYYVIQRRFHRHYINSQSPETNNNRLRRFIVVAIFVGLTSRIIVSIAATASHEFYVTWCRCVPIAKIVEHRRDKNQLCSFPATDFNFEGMMM